MLRHPTLAIFLAGACRADDPGGPGTTAPGPARVDVIASPDRCALDEQGHLACAALTPALDGVIALDAGADRVCALTDDGVEAAVWCSNPLTDPTARRAAAPAFVALTAAELGGTPLQVRASELADRAVVVTRTDGDPVLWHPEEGTIEEVAGLPALAEAAVVHDPDAFTAILLCGISTNAEAACLRVNHAGLQGEGTPAAWPDQAEAVEASRHVPCVVTVEGVQCGEAQGWTTAGQGWSGVAQLAVGEAHGCALSLDGKVACFGAALGAPAPWDVALPAAATRISAGGPSSCAVLDDGEAWCWTADGAGPLDPPAPFDGQLNDGARGARAPGGPAPRAWSPGARWRPRPAPGARG